MLHVILDKLLYYIKGESFKLDKNIPCSYLFSLSVLYAASFLRGYLSFFKFKVLIERNVTIKCKKKITFVSALRIARGVYIDALSTNGIIMGRNVSIGKYTTIECTGSLTNIGLGLKVGNNVGMGTHGFWGCAGGIEVGDDTIFGNYVSLHSENHNYANLDIPIRLQGVNRKGIKIGNNCWIGAKATILDGTILGNGCIVAAGAVVRGTFPDNAVIGGVPAQILKMRK